MRVFSRPLGTDSIEAAAHVAEQEALICLKLSDEEIGTARERQAIATLRDRLIRAVQAGETGEFEELAFAEGFGTLSFTGTSADRLAESVLPILRTHDSRPGSYLLKRFGEAGAREQSIVLGARH